MTYLQEYYKIQKDILLVYRPTLKNSWSTRHWYLGEKWQPHIKYNHRLILRDEVVLEYDDDNKSLNSRLAQRVCRKLESVGISYARWRSGNKSHHIHFFIKPKEARSVSLLKKVVLKHFGTYYYDETKDKIYEYMVEGAKRILPDLRLASDNHLIRAEYGVHEKTQKNKTPVKVCEKYPKPCSVPVECWETYMALRRTSIKRKVTMASQSLKDLPGFKFISSYDFKDAEDGRERAMFILIHVLKDSYKEKEEFKKFLYDWYKYNGGYKLSEWDVKHKVDYHWNRNYNIGERQINDLLEQIGREDLIQH